MLKDDYLLEVDGADLRQATKEQGTQAIKDAKAVVRILVARAHMSSAPKAAPKPTPRARGKAEDVPASSDGAFTRLLATAKPPVSDAKPTSSLLAKTRDLPKTTADEDGQDKMSTKPTPQQLKAMLLESHAPKSNSAPDKKPHTISTTAKPPITSHEPPKAGKAPVPTFSSKFRSVVTAPPPADDSNDEQSPDLVEKHKADPPAKASSAAVVIDNGNKASLTLSETAVKTETNVDSSDDESSQPPPKIVTSITNKNASLKATATTA